MKIDFHYTELCLKGIGFSKLDNSTFTGTIDNRFYTIKFDDNKSYYRVFVFDFNTTNEFEIAFRIDTTSNSFYVLYKLEQRLLTLTNKLKHNNKCKVISIDDSNNLLLEICINNTKSRFIELINILSPYTSSMYENELLCCCNR